MIPPELPDFPSRPTPDGHGRVYQVHEDLHLVAYFIPDGMTLRRMGARVGFFLYAFLRPARVGYWNWTHDAEDLARIMRQFREAASPALEPPGPRAPGGEPPTIRPTFNRSLEQILRDAAMPPRHFLCISNVPAQEMEPEPAKVIPIRPRATTDP